jgi:hypothetical protein
MGSLIFFNNRIFFFFQLNSWYRGRILNLIQLLKWFLIINFKRISSLLTLKTNFWWRWGFSLLFRLAILYYWLSFLYLELVLNWNPRNSSMLKWLSRLKLLAFYRVKLWHWGKMFLLWEFRVSCYFFICAYS